MNDAQALQRAQTSKLGVAAVLCLVNGAGIITYKDGSFVRFLGGESC